MNITPPSVKLLLPLIAEHTLASITLEPNIPTINKNGTKKHKNIDFTISLSALLAALPFDCLGIILLYYCKNAKDYKKYR